MTVSPADLRCSIIITNAGFLSLLHIHNVSISLRLSLCAKPLRLLLQSDDLIRFLQGCHGDKMRSRCKTTECVSVISL